MSPRAKLAVEMGPLAVLAGTFIVAKLAVADGRELIYATIAFIPCTLLALAYSYAVERKVSPMAVVTAILVTALGGLTIYLDDDTFIKQKPTYVSGAIGSILLIGLAFGRPLVKFIMQGTIQMEDEGWRKLTLRWGLFMLFLAGMNEVVWRNFSDGIWLTYKIVGIVPLTVGFLLSQAPLMSEYGVEPAKDGEADPFAEAVNQNEKR